jgi:hypothetical protein
LFKRLAFRACIDMLQTCTPQQALSSHHTTLRVKKHFIW